MSWWHFFLNFMHLFFLKDNGLHARKITFKSTAVMMWIELTPNFSSNPYKNELFQTFFCSLFYAILVSNLTCPSTIKCFS